MAEDQAATASGSGRSVRFYLFGGAVIVAAVVAAGYFHLSRSQNVAAAREARANVVERGPRVEVVAASQGPSERTITMLADVRANTTAIMYAKVSGYMKSILVDRGDRVQAGQIIAVIESPEVDQQYYAAVTDLEHKRRNLARSQELLAKGNTTQVAMLQFETDARVAEANVKGLETMKGYQTLRAPFAGRVTADHQRPDQLCQRAADYDHFRRQSVASVLLRAAAGRAVHQCRRRRGHRRCQQSGTHHEGEGLPDDRRA
jgi:membrane fusion protein (multidrug efflux system)